MTSGVNLCGTLQLSSQEKEKNAKDEILGRLPSTPSRKKQEREFMLGQLLPPLNGVDNSAGARGIGEPRKTKVLSTQTDQTQKKAGGFPVGLLKCRVE